MKDSLCQAAAAAAELLIATAFPHIIKSETMAIHSNPWGGVGLGWEFRNELDASTGGGCQAQ